MKKAVIVGVLALGMIGLLSALAFGAPPPATADITVNAAVNNSAFLQVTDALVSLAGGPDFDNSADTTAGFLVKANWNWTLQANALASLPESGGGPNTLPGSSVQVKDEAGTMQGADNDVTVASGTKTSGENIVVDYKQNFQWADPVGTYQAAHTYTLAFN